MKNFFVVHGKTMALFGVMLVLVLVLGYVALQAGPLAPVPITVETVQVKALQPALFGMGTVEARVTHKIGPTVAGRIKRVDVQTGDVVKAGQVLGEMDPVDLDDKIAAQEATIKRAQASVMAVEAQVRFHTGQCIGRHTGALFKRKANLIRPVDVIRVGRDQAQLHRRIGVKRVTDLRAG